MKSFLGINSPSKLFAQLGGYVGEGFAQGIEGETDTVTDALNSLTSGFKLGIPNLSISSAQNAALQLDGVENEKTIILEMDGDVVARKVVKNANHLSFMKNMSVVG